MRRIQNNVAQYHIPHCMSFRQLKFEEPFDHAAKALL